MIAYQLKLKIINPEYYTYNCVHKFQHSYTFDLLVPPQTETAQMEYLFVDLSAVRLDRSPYAEGSHGCRKRDTTAAGLCEETDRLQEICGRISLGQSS